MWRWTNIVCIKKKGYNIIGYDKIIKSENILNELNNNNKFDVIYSCNFIEHLINPIKEINNILNFLNQDGYLIFISPCIDTYTFEITHYHTVFFCGRSLNLLCDKLNLKIVDLKNFRDTKMIVLQQK